MINVICVHTAWLWWSLCCRTEWRWRDAQMFFGDDESTTAIQEHESHDCIATPHSQRENATLSKRESHELSGAYYDLQGRKIANGQKPKAKGLYIVNGKVVVIK